MNNIGKLSIVVILVLILAVIGFTTNYSVKKDIGFEEVFNNISYFSNSSPEDIDDLNTNNIYILIQRSNGAHSKIKISKVSHYLLSIC